MTKFLLALLFVFPALTNASEDFVSVCDRSRILRFAVVKQLTKTCSEITEWHLNSLTSLQLVNFGSSPEAELLPGDLADFKNLTWLRVTDGIRIAPGALVGASSITNLSLLNIANQELTSAHLAGTESLKDVFIQSGKIRELNLQSSHENRELKEVHIIDLELDKTNLTLPANLVSLQFTAIIFNTPPVIQPAGELVNLKEFSITEAEIGGLPEDFFSAFESIGDLNISGTDITTLPTTIFDSVKIDVLEMFGNPIPELPKTVTQGISEIHFQSNLEADKEENSWEEN